MCIVHACMLTQTDEFNPNNNNLINFQNFIKIILYLDLNAYNKPFRNVFKRFVLSVPQNNTVLSAMGSSLVQTMEIKKLTYTAEIFQAL